MGNAIRENEGSRKEVAISRQESAYETANSRSKGGRQMRARPPRSESGGCSRILLRTCSIRLGDGEYRWGRLDVGAPAGYSAVVTFKADGGKPSVEVYLSPDFL